MDDIYEQFYRACEQWRTLLGIRKTVWTERLPKEMLIGEPDKEGWVDWAMIAPEVSLAPQLDALEAEAQIRIPRSFKSWFGLYYTLDMDCGVVALPECPSNDPFGSLRECWLPDHAYYDHLRDLKLIPFGIEKQLDAGPICFDMRVDMPNADWPIVYWDHEWDGTEKEIGPVIFSNFGKLLECVTHSLLHPVQSNLVAKFFDIDPEGAGGPGRDYWRYWHE